MEGPEVIDIAREAIFVLLKISLPIMLIALVVGLAVSLFQALTQIQEMTLAFIPKILAIFFSLFMLMPFVVESMQDFHGYLAQKIIEIE